MKTKLPNKFIELTIQSYAHGQPAGDVRKLLALATEINSDFVMGITEKGTNFSYHSCYHRDVSDARSVLIDRIEFIDNTSDRYYDFCFNVHQRYLSQTLDEMAKNIKQEFKEMMEVCPENEDTLFEQLKQRVDQLK